MVAFPEDFAPLLDEEMGDEYGTILSKGYEAGSTYSRTGRAYPLYSFMFRAPIMEWASYANLYDFYVARKGASGTFTFFDWNGWDSSPVGVRWPKLYVGVGNGSTTVFDLPMKSSSSGTAYVAGSSAAGTLGAGTGADGRDRFTFSVAPAADAVIEWQATGRRGVTCRFGQDKLSFKNIARTLVSTGLLIEEAR